MTELVTSLLAKITHRSRYPVVARSREIPPDRIEFGAAGLLQPPSPQAIERLRTLGPRIEYIPVPLGLPSRELPERELAAEFRRLGLPNPEIYRTSGLKRWMLEGYFRDILADDLQKLKGRRGWTDLGFRATAVAVNGRHGDPEHLPLVRDVADALVDGVPVEYPNVGRTENSRQMGVSRYKNLREPCIDDIAHDALGDHPDHLRREVFGVDGDIMPAFIIYDLTGAEPKNSHAHPLQPRDPTSRVTVIKDGWAYSDVPNGRDSKVIEIDNNFSDPTKRPPILKIYVFDYGIGSGYVKKS